MIEAEWLRCPLCGGKTRNKLRKDTELKHYPLFCPKCKQEVLINAKLLMLINSIIKRWTVRRRDKIGGIQCQFVKQPIYSALRRQRFTL